MHLGDLRAGADIVVTDGVLDGLDPIVAPGTSVGQLDMTYNLARRPCRNRAYAAATSIPRSVTQDEGPDQGMLLRPGLIGGSTRSRCAARDWRESYCCCSCSTGGVMPIGGCSRRWLSQSTYSATVNLRSSID